MALTHDQRRDMVNKAAQRIQANLDAMTGYTKLQYVSKLVNMLDDLHLSALEFAVDMTPEFQERSGLQLLENNDQAHK